MTVSRVLRGEGYVSKKVKTRVAQAVAALGYIQNRMASVQRGMENPMVGVILPTLNNTVFTEVLAGINDTLSAQGIRPVFGVSEYAQDEEEKLIRDMLAWQPCGLILSGLEHTTGARRAIDQSDVRVAEIMDIEGDAIEAAFGFSQQVAGSDMAEHLLSRGHRKIAYLGSQGRADLRAAKRFDAFEATLLASGGTIVYKHIATRASSMLLGRELTAACLAEIGTCDAIYFANDDLAAGGLMHCLSHGIAVPQDVALAGFNDLPFLDALPQRITTTRTPRYEIGVQAAQYVAQTPDAVTPELQALLVVGDTT